MCTFRLTNLTCLESVRIDSAGGLHLNGLKRLKSLVVGAPLSKLHITGSPLLKSLTVSNQTDVTCFEALKQMPQLRGLHIKEDSWCFAFFTDSCLEHLKLVPQLSELQLTVCRLLTVPALLKVLGELKHLKTLTIFGPKPERLEDLGTQLPHLAISHYEY